VLNEHGVVIRYKEHHSNADGTFSWVYGEKLVIKEDDGTTYIQGTTPNIPNRATASTVLSGNNNQIQV
jgi:hypothetical protein